MQQQINGVQILNGEITNILISSTAGIVYSKLNLYNSIRNTDIYTNAGIDVTKLADGIINNTVFNFLQGVSSNIQSQIDSKVSLNPLITSGTATKVTYDTRGFILSGTNATTDDISEGSTNLYYTDVRADASADARIAVQKGASSGIAPLGVDTKIPSAYLPNITITDTFVVGSQVAMLALTAEKGDIAIRTDLDQTFILKGTDPSLLADWEAILAPTGGGMVMSVNGLTGNVSLTTLEIPEGTNLYFTTSRVLATEISGFTSGSGTVSATDTILQAIQKLDGNIGLKANLASPTFTGTVTLSTLQATGSGGLLIKSNSGTDVALLGAGGGAGTTFYGGINGTDAAFSGRIRITGNSSTPSFSTDAYVWRTNSNGLVLGGVGATNDIFIVNGSGSNVARVATGSTNFRFYSAIEPSSHDGAALGTTSRSWSDVFVASGGVINFSNGDYTITHSTGTLSFSGDVLFAKTGITSILTNTSDGSDNKAITIGGGGAYSITRGSGIAMIGNEYATVGGDLELLAGDSAISGAIKFYVGDGAGGAKLAGKIERTTGAFHIGTSGTNTGTLIFNGATSGGITMKSANAAGTWTMTLPTSAGTSGQVLQTDGSGNTSWASTSSAPEQVYAASSATLLFYSDVDTYTAEVIALATLSLYYSGGQERFLSGVDQQVSASTIWASATRMTSAIIRSGYVYVYIDSGAAARIYRCLLTNDITVAGNWTQLTISGTALPVGQYNCLIGYGDGKFWISNYVTNYIPYTLSGTTLTSGTAVTITSCSYRGDYSRVNDNGFYATFGVAPYIRFASFSGTVDTARQSSNSQRPTYALSNSFYIQNPNANTIYSLIQI